MKIYLQSLFLVAIAACLLGCRSVNPKDFAEKTALSHLPAWHSIRIVPKPKTTNITTLDKINPLWWGKNLDHPEPPAWYRPGKKFRRIAWFKRNSFNNLTYYVVGIADKEHVRSGKYPETIYNPNGGWNYSVAKYKHWRLPMISYRGRKIEFYFGWRNQGNFGIKFVKKKEKKTQAPQSGAFSYTTIALCLNSCNILHGSTMRGSTIL